MEGLGGSAGGSGELVARLVSEHRDELAYDFRHLYSASIWGVAGHEFGALTVALLADPASRLHAVVSEWEYPLSREAMSHLSVIDVLLMRWQGQKYKPWPRPWDKAAITQRAQRITDERLLRKLRPHLYKEKSNGPKRVG